MTEWYSPNQLLTYNRVIHMCIGERGIGKSYAFKKFPIDKFFKTGKKFIYLRRFKTELDKIRKYFDDVRQEYPDHVLEVKGWRFYCDGVEMGEAIPLSVWQSVKSTAYPDYDIIIFDEFIREKDKSGYLPNEVNSFLNLCHTVFRKRSGVRAFCLSNSVSVVNPYFLAFNIQLDPNKRITFSSDKEFRDFVVVENTNGVYTANYDELSPYEKMISHMEYGKMALNNEFISDTNTFIMKRTANASFVFGMKYLNRDIGIWVDGDLGLLFMSDVVDPSCRHVYPMTLGDHAENLYYKNRWKDNFHLNKLVNAFQKGYLRFENQVVKNDGYEIFKGMNLY